MAGDSSHGLIGLLEDMLWLLGSGRFKIECEPMMGIREGDTRFRVCLTVYHPYEPKKYSRVIPANHALSASHTLILISELVREAEKQHRKSEIRVMEERAKDILKGEL